MSITSLAEFQDHVHVFFILKTLFKVNNVWMVERLVDLDLSEQLDRAGLAIVAS